jgi:hypothetical protein
MCIRIMVGMWYERVMQKMDNPKHAHNTFIGARGGAVGVKALRYKLQGRGFESRLCH